MLIDEIRSNIEVIEKIEISINAPEGKIWKILLTKVCYISYFMINVTAPRKFRAKEVYFNDQNMRLRTADNKMLGLVSDMHDHKVLEHQVIKQSTPERMKMKNERPTSKEVQVKKTMQTNSSKKADSGAPNRVKHERDRAYQRANNTQSYSRINFGLFSPILSN